MDKNTIVDRLVENNSMTKVAAKAAVDTVFDAVSGALANGEEVAIHNFGKFTVNNRAARAGRNPATGADIQIAASKTVGFKVGKYLKDRL